MGFEEVMEAMRASLQDSLDELISPRSSSHSKTLALQSIEKNLAKACFGTSNDSEARDSFLALQFTFECNVPSKLLQWISYSTTRLEQIMTKGNTEEAQVLETEELAYQLSLSLSLIQGTVLNHRPSKIYLGRRCSLEILLDLLLASRHLSTPSDPSSAESKPSNGTPHLTSIVLETLLCILVDSSSALRSFEEASGVQAVVKLLKRAGTPREVRMKCLEFLYFYLLDETPATACALQSTQSTPPPTVPPIPARLSKPYLSATPQRPPSRYGSSTFSFSSSITSLSVSGSSSSSSSSTSSSSSYSFSSTSSNVSSSTAPSSTQPSPVKASFSFPSTRPPLKTPGSRIITPLNQHRSPPNSPAFSSAAKFPHLRSMMMLKREVDYIPQSPKKLPRLGSRPAHRKSLSHSALSYSSPSLHSRSPSQTVFSRPGRESTADTLLVIEADTANGILEVSKRPKGEEKWKTTEEKKELLGTMLGNVDALVEGVRKAGIWGLG